MTANCSSDATYTEALKLWEAQSFEEAVRLMHVAAESGSSEAMNRLSRLYRAGKHVEKDEKRADNLVIQAVDAENYEISG